MNNIPKVENSLRLVFGVQLSVLVAIVFVAFFSLNRLIDDAIWVSRTYEVISLIRDSLVQNSSIKVGGRSYLLVGQPHVLAPMMYAKEKLIGDVARIRALTRENPMQVETVKKYEKYITAHIDLIALIVRTYDMGDKQKAIEPLRDGRLERATDDVTNCASTMLEEEFRLLDDRRQKLDRMLDTTYKLTPFLIAVQIASAVIAYVLTIKVLYQSVMNEEFPDAKTAV